MRERARQRLGFEASFRVMKASCSQKAIELERRYGWPAGDRPGLPLATAEGVRLYAVERAGRLRIVMEVDEDATHRTLRSALPLALRWRDALLEHQGPWDGGGRNLLLIQLSDRQQFGGGPAAAARWLNEKIGNLLKEALAFEREAEAACPRLRTFDDWLEWRPKANPYALVHARDLLCDLGWSKARAEAVVEDGLQRLRCGQRPFVGPYDPVSRARVERIVRTFRAGPKWRAYIRTMPEVLRGLYEKGGGRDGAGRRKAEAHPARTRTRRGVQRPT
jgi:hypothetical protein